DELAGDAGVALVHVVAQAVEVRGIAAGQRLVRGPRPADPRIEALELGDYAFGERPVRRDLAAEDREERGGVVVRLELGHVIAAHLRGIRGTVVVERPHARVAPGDV